MPNDFTFFLVFECRNDRSFKHSLEKQVLFEIGYLVYTWAGEWGRVELSECNLKTYIFFARTLNFLQPRLQNVQFYWLDYRSNDFTE